MRTLYYPAVIETGEGGGFCIFFPDLPGCVSAGNPIDDVMANAEQALAGHIELSAEYGDKIAEPSDLAAIRMDAGVEEVARVLVRVDMPGQ